MVAEDGLATGLKQHIGRLLLFALIVRQGGGRAVHAESVDFTESEVRQILSMSPLPDPLVDSTNHVVEQSAAVHLGRFLFFDPRLSANGEISCATCHQPDLGFTDGRALAVGMAEGRRNTPTIWNVAYQRWLALDGRFDSLWSQALDPLEGEREMGSTRLQICRLVSREPELRRAYEDVFGSMPDLSDEARFPARGRPVPEKPTHSDEVSWRSMRREDQLLVNRVFSNLGKAIAAYEQTLIRRDAPFDRFVAGLRSGDLPRQDSISNSAKRGLKLFLGRGNCVLCHSGPDFSDGEFHNLSLPALDGGRPRDAGRFAAIRLLREGEFNAASRFSDDSDGSRARLSRSLSESPDKWGQFKTPSLRNVEKTAPYMHQGQFKSLRDVVRFYSTLEGADRTGHHQESILVPLMLSKRQIEDLVAFLLTLTQTNDNPSLLKPPEHPFVSESSASSEK